MRNIFLYNCVINEHLYELIRFYIRLKQIKIESLYELSLSDAKKLATDAVEWSKTELTQNITRPVSDLEHYNDNWAPLYYMMLAYANEILVGKPTIHRLSLEELRQLAIDTTSWLSRLSDEMREINEDDLSKI